MSENCGKNFIRVARIDGERRDLLSIHQAEMRPGLTGVGGLVDAIANGEIGTVQSLATAYINNVGVRGRNGNGTDGLRGLMVENWVPGAAVVVRFPDAAVYLAHIKHIGLAGNTGGRASATAPKWADHAPVQFLVSVFWKLCPTGDCC